jgi:hypothetical protein
VADRLTKQHEAELRYIAAGPAEEFLAEALAELDATRADLAELLAAQPRCQQRLPDRSRCKRPATRDGSTGDVLPKVCDECPAPHLDELQDLPTAAIIRRLTHG